MRTDYESLYELEWKDVKNYILSVCRQDVCERIIHCESQKEWNVFLQDDDVYESVKNDMKKAYYHTQGYDDLEKHLIMMNVLFRNHDCQSIHIQLQKILSQHRMTLDEYCLLRHVIDFSHLSFEDIVRELYECYGVSAKECAKMALLEDDVDLACVYLMKCETCEHELLDIVKSYSWIQYFRLKRFYKQRELAFTVLTTH